MNYERGNEGINVTMIVAILIFLAVLIAGFFKSDRVLWDTFNLKSILRLPCGLTVNHPKNNDKAVFPIAVDGYANECGWNMKNGSAGTAQIFDDKGLPVSTPAVLIISNSGAGYPMYFKNSIPLYKAPMTDTGKIVFVSTTGLVYAVPVHF